MTEKENKSLRAYYHSLLEQQRVIEDTKDFSISSQPVALLKEEIDRIESEFPNLIPPFVPDRFFDFRGDDDIFYKVAGIRSYLGIALARVKVAIETTGSTPVTQTREFAFVKDADLRRVIERDYQEIQTAYVARCWKSVIILSGGAIEALLTDLLVRNAARAISATKAPRQPDLTKWDLVDLINVAVELKLVSGGVEKLSHSVREYRNLVHPGNEVRKKLTFDTEEAKIALEVLHIVHRDLSI